jgi:hypothetical protein
MSKTIILKNGIVKTKQADGSIKETPQNYSDIISSALDWVPKDGLTYQILKKRNRIDRALEECLKNSSPGSEPEFKMEDSDYENLKECVLGMRWIIRDPFVFEFLSLFE